MQTLLHTKFGRHLKLCCC